MEIIFHILGVLSIFHVATTLVLPIMSSDRTIISPESKKAIGITVPITIVYVIWLV